MKNILLLLIALIVSFPILAQDNLALTKYMNPGQIPPFFITLGGGTTLIDKTFVDDDGKVRTDKIYYTTTHSYQSTYKMQDLRALLDPANGKLESLFNDTTINKGPAGTYLVNMTVSTPFKNFECQNQLTFNTTTSGTKTVFTYRFSQFNMLFTDIVIQVVAENKGSNTIVSLNQIAVIKGSSYQKLKSVFAVGTFENYLKSNLKNFKSKVGGI